MFCHINFQFFSAFFISEAQTQGFRPFAPQKGLPFLSHSLTLSRMLAKIKMKTFLLSLKMPHLFVLAQCLICFVIFVFAGKKQIPSFEINKKRCQGMPHDLFKIMLLLPENGSFRTKIVIYIYIYIYTHTHTHTHTLIVMPVCGYALPLGQILVGSSFDFNILMAQS